MNCEKCLIFSFLSDLSMFSYGTLLFILKTCSSQCPIWSIHFKKLFSFPWQVSEILKKSEDDRTEEEHFVLQQSTDVVRGIQKRAKTRELAKQRQQEVINYTLSLSLLEYINNLLDNFNTGA